jgi:hypothetical protein
MAREAIESELQPNNMNREVGCCLSNDASLSSALSRNLLTMTPDLRGYAGQYTLGSSSPKATESMLAR